MAAETPQQYLIFRRSDERIFNNRLDMTVDRVFIHKQTGMCKVLLAFPNEGEYREFLKDLSTIYSVVKKRNYN